LKEKPFKGGSQKSKGKHYEYLCKRTRGGEIMNNKCWLKTIFANLIICITMSLSASAQESAENFIDLKIEGVALFSSYSTVTRQLGNPLQKKQGKSFYSECSESRETPLTVQYSGLIIELSGDGKGRNFEVQSIEVSSSKWSVGSGLRVGAPKKDVLAKFGKPATTENESGLEVFGYFTTNDGGVAFYFLDNKLVKVTLGYNSC
jgi:hypothetical protein